ncbi:LLM class flavin-dependent oxidoreductase [Sphingomonas gei]|uniref:LLM class flavin-dependent oxidoreductase n=1 Tax=Sphingomonas gei TaxID=1395960 RepID=A0A4S1XEF8_9SPHN|nr:LLM class flavin-dependent oxidoreductase [Sphingomonas gei]TGX54348.1 LLM class flavin-dependent oxidoreductase [Sphingomonas gei]
MKIWQFSEQAYHPAFQQPGAMRVTLPQSKCDPFEAGRLLNRYLDEYMLADELGLNIMVNEHHAAATCMSTSCMTTLAILARQTSKAQLLALGIPLANRSNPLRVAEEIAMVDALSGGRLEVGLVKGAAYELFMSNRQPTGFMDRFWEAHDLILAALSNQGDNFSWEGEHFHYRTVSMWPRPIQQPHPPIWMTASSATSAREYGKRGYTCATFLSGAVARSVFTGYREAYVQAHGEQPGQDKLAYLALVACAGDRKTAFARAEKMKSYFTTAARLDPQFRNPLGFSPVDANIRMLQAGANAMRPRMRNGDPLPVDGTIEQYMDAGLFFVGTPDDVHEQLARFHDETGGFGNLLMMGQAGELGHADTVDNLTLVGREVAPRLAELSTQPIEVRYEAVG